jgi:arylsulfatase A-like enzyme
VPLGVRLVVGLFLAAGLVPPRAIASSEKPRPNVVLMLADDLGYGDLGVYGHHVIKTPSLDRLAAEGLRLTSYYAPSPLCSPSRASLLTGRIHFRAGIESWIPPDSDIQLGPRELTAASLLKRVGYQTFMAGKWHLNGGLDVAAHTQPGDHGFDYWLALHAWAIPNHRNPTNFFRNGKPAGEIAGFTAQIVVDEALSWLDRRRKEAPFFVYLPFPEPHGTIASPDFFNALYSSFTTGKPDPMANDGRVPSNLAARGPGEYYANVTHLDYQVGRFLEGLDRRGLRETTLVVFTSDNGPVTTDWRHWYEVNLYGDTGGFRGRKADLYEGGIRVPAIVRWPGHVAAGTVSDAPVAGYDLLPTLAAVCGFPVPADRPIDGENVSPLLMGRPETRAKPLYWEFDDDQGFSYALRDGTWKLLADRPLAKVHLYDLASDRFEVTDLAETKKDAVDALVAKLRTVHASVESDPLKPARPTKR